MKVGIQRRSVPSGIKVETGMQIFNWVPESLDRITEIGN
jgi:hypothetical protein